MLDEVTIRGKTYKVEDVLEVWNGRRESGQAEMDKYLPQVRVNRMFAAGKQHLRLNTRDGRVVEKGPKDGNVELVTSNFLDQYINTAIGRLSSNDYMPNFLVSQENEDAELIAATINKAFAWGWENEWYGDQFIMDLLRHMAIDGTVGIRTRYDRRYGEIVGDVPYRDGVPIFDDSEAYKYVEEQVKKGETADIRSYREGKVCWELLTMDNFLVPPGYADSKRFPWIFVKRPVSVMEIKDRYGELAEDVIEENIEATGSLTASYNDGEAGVKLEGMAMLYTGYEMPNSMNEKGLTVVMTENSLLDMRHTLPLSEHPLGPRTGVHFFRWGVLPGRFIGKSFIENGIGPQKVYNKRLTQINAIIDRSLPKTYIEEQSLALPITGEPLEVIPIRSGAPLPVTVQGVNPGQWMLDDLKQQVDSAERALGIRGISMGQAPQGVSAYSAMALLTENDALKLDPVSREFGLGVNELCWDTMENMRSWPDEKKMDIEGPTGKLETWLFKKSTIPPRYLLKQPQGGSLPRSQAAEIQKINDIWAAAAGTLPLSWYIESLEAGKPQPVPPSMGESHKHKAHLENLIILSTGQAPPVAPYDDHQAHIPEHRREQMESQARLDAGDESAQEEVDAFEEHVLEHEAVAQQNAPDLAMAQGGMVQAQQPSNPGGHPPVSQEPSPTEMGSGSASGGGDLATALGQMAQ
jgi:hypothetical protein